MISARLSPAACMALTCVLLQPSVLEASQTTDRQVSERWERKPGEFEEYRSFLGRFDGHDAPVSQAGSETRYHDNKIEQPGHTTVDQEETRLTSLKSAARKSAKIAGQVIETTAKVVAGTVVVAAYIVALCTRAPRESESSQPRY